MEETKKEEIKKEAEHKHISAEEKDIQENKIWALLSYLGILFLIPLLLKKESKFAQFHARQGLVYFVACLVWGFISGIPFVGWFIVAPFGGLLLLILWFAAVMKVLNGEYWEIPVLGKWAKEMKI
ncbi:MAG: DUF4870 domain-containing protein [Patescibacteria group bacterium]